MSTALRARPTCEGPSNVTRGAPLTYIRQWRILTADLQGDSGLHRTGGTAAGPGILSPAAGQTGRDAPRWVGDSRYGQSTEDQMARLREREARWREGHLLLGRIGQRVADALRLSEGGERRPDTHAAQDSGCRSEGGVPVRDELFDELVESLREGGRIVRGEEEAARETELDEPSVGAIRDEFGLSQAKFAAMLGISVRTLQNWEQGRRRPRGPARVLLLVAARHPHVILDTIRHQDDRVSTTVKVDCAHDAEVQDAFAGSARAPTLARVEWSDD